MGGESRWIAGRSPFCEFMVDMDHLPARHDTEVYVDLRRSTSEYGGKPRTTRVKITAIIVLEPPISYSAIFLEFKMVKYINDRYINDDTLLYFYLWR